MGVKEIVKFYREARGLTLAQMASEFGITKQAVMCWESGKAEPGIAMLNRWCASDDPAISKMGREIARLRFPLLTSLRED